MSDFALFYSWFPGEWNLSIEDFGYWFKAKCIYIHRLKKGFSTTHPLLNKEVQALKNWLSIRTSYPHAESEWVFLSRKGNPLSRQQFYHIISTSGGNAGLSLEIHPHMLRHSCGFALANMGIDTRLIQDYLGIAIFVILSGIPPAMQGVFTASGIEPEDDSVTLFYRDSWDTRDGVKNYIILTIYQKWLTIY